jgi:hypothetical protein
MPAPIWPRKYYYLPLTPKKSKIRTQDHALHYHWPQKIPTHDHALHHHWPQKDKDSNPTSCTTPPLALTPKVSTPRPCTTPPLIPTKTRIRTPNHTYCFPHEIQFLRGFRILMPYHLLPRLQKMMTSYAKSIGIRQFDDAESLYYPITQECGYFFNKGRGNVLCIWVALVNNTDYQ